MSDNQAGLVDFAMFRPGENVGTSEWVTVDQPMISGFGDITLDPDPMHVDPEWGALVTSFLGTYRYDQERDSLISFGDSLLDAWDVARGQLQE